MLTLTDLAAAVGGRCAGDASVVPRGVHHDSRRVGAGDLFVATVGATFDGHRFVAEARRRGAAAVVVEREVDRGPQILVDRGREALPHLARLVYGDPTAELRVVGVTGTNGKTTVVETLGHVLERAGERVARMGTLGTRFGQLAFDQGFNTPEADEVIRIARRLRDAGATAWLLEATSHGLAQRRLDGVSFEAAAFTNLTRDHLDLHRDEAAYAAAKRRLFVELAPRHRVVVVDDATGRSLAEGALRVSVRPEAAADVRPRGPLIPQAHGWAFSAMTPWGPIDLCSPRIGLHEASNLLVVAALALVLGVPPEVVASAIVDAPPVPGRLERFEGAGRLVFVDYAHSPDALAHALRAARLETVGALVAVFGCGGDRDVGKRPLMGAVAERLADRTIVTTDNPRHERPQAIADAVLEGAPSAGCILDRRAAIETAIASLDEGDVALIAGRGHEEVQRVGGEDVPLDDREVVRHAIEERFGSC